MYTFLFTILTLIETAYCISGLIWNDKQNTFIPIFDIPTFRELQQEALKLSYQLERHNFNKAPIRLLFHQDSGIITLYDNNTRITGFFGEIWTFLAEYANFTLVMKSVPEKRIGIKPTINSSFNGLLRYIELNEADIVVKIEVYDYWSQVVDFFLPLWRDQYRLFVQVSYQENTFWIIDIFTYENWLVFAIFNVLFYAASQITRAFAVKYKREITPRLDIKDYLFYYFGAFTQRSYFLLGYQKTYRIINTTACIFSMLVLGYYSSKTLSLMLNKIENEPFDDIKSLSKHTNYSVISEKDSVVHLVFEFLQIYQDAEPDNELRYLIKSNRIKFSRSRATMYYIACKSEKDYALLESEYLKERIIKYGCTFKPLGKAYFGTWVTGGARKNFKCKRTIDLGILKLFESGLLNALKQRLIGIGKTHRYSTYEPVDLQKVYIVVVFFWIGVGASIIIFLIEKIVASLQ